VASRSILGRGGAPGFFPWESKGDNIVLAARVMPTACRNERQDVVVVVVVVVVVASWLMERFVISSPLGPRAASSRLPASGGEGKRGSGL